MKFYRLSWCEPGEGIRYAWHGSRRHAERDAKRDANRVRLEWPEVDPENLDLQIKIEPFPTMKAKLLRWLNAHASHFC